MMGNMVKIGGLWKNTGKKGDYLQGYLGMGKILIFPNGYKKGERDPDYYMFVAEKKKQGQDDQPQAQAPAYGQTQPAPQQAQPAQTPYFPPPEDEEPPF